MMTGGIKPRAAAIMAAFALSCFGLLLFLWLSFGGPVPLQPKGYRITAQFTEATTLATEADVRISGVPVGKIKSIEPGNGTGRSKVEMQIDAKYAPLPADTRAILRQKTLLGETYVELTPGSRRDRTIPENGSLPNAAVAQSVQLDEIFRAFDPTTRRAFQTWMQQQSKAIGPYARQVNAALGNLGPFAEEANQVVGVLNRQQAAVKALVANGGTVFDALSERDGQLRQMITSLNTVFATTGRRDAELKQAVVALPTFEREARTTLKRLDAFADNADPLVTQLRPAARELSPTLIDLQKTAPDLKALFRDLGPLIDASRTGFPAAARLLRELKPLVQQAHPALQQLQPILAFLGLYKREAAAFLANTVAASQATNEADGVQKHYLRTTNPLTPEILAAYPQRIGSNRPNAYMLPGGFDKLASGLESYETRQCGRGVPALSPGVDGLPALLAPSVIEGINSLILPGGQVPAPPCKQQGKFTFQGRTSQFPTIRPRP